MSASDFLAGSTSALHLLRVDKRPYFSRSAGCPIRGPAPHILNFYDSLAVAFLQSAHRGLSLPLPTQYLVGMWAERFDEEFK